MKLTRIAGVFIFLVMFIGTMSVAPWPKLDVNGDEPEWVIVDPETLEPVDDSDPPIPTPPVVNPGFVPDEILRPHQCPTSIVRIRPVRRWPVSVLYRPPAAVIQRQSAPAPRKIFAEKYVANGRS